GLADRHAFVLLRDLVETAPHRLAGSPGYAAAADWAERTMRGIGLANVRRQTVLAEHWVRGEVERVEMNGGPLGPRPLAACALGRSVGTPPGGITAPVVEVDGIEDLQRRAAAGEDFAGRIVFFNQPMDPTVRATFQAYGKAVAQRSRGAIEAARLGAVAALVRSMSTAWDDVPHTGAMRYEEGVEKIPAFALGVLSAETLSAGLRAGTVESVTVESRCQTLPDARTWNVMGEIPGSEHPEEILVVGGHLDCWDKGQGAHDDGGGCCAALEAARLLLAAGVVPKRTIRVVLFANEENGLAGGRGYAAEFGSKEKHLLAIESDGGSFAPRGIALDLPPAALERLRPLGEPLAAVGAERVLPGGGGADIGPLAAHGCRMGSLRVEDSRYFDLHHSDNDTLEAVHPRELELGAVVMAYWLAILADAGPDALE
ncbi:MAG: M20/M25/M40 family metallo-hydrolase, partial [Planctomycetota bacterium]